MGMFDSILFKCEECGKVMEAQSKGGNCELDKYDYRSVPLDVALDANRHAPFHCDCGATYEFELPNTIKNISLIVKKTN